MIIMVMVMDDHNITMIVHMLIGVEERFRFSSLKCGGFATSRSSPR